MRHARHATLWVAAVVSSSLTPGAATAQPAAVAADSCTVEVEPPELGAGISVVEVTTHLSMPVGLVIDLTIAEDSGIELSSRDRLEWLYGAPGRENAKVPRPIETAEESRSATLRLNLLAANPGTHRIVLRGERGSCAGTLTVRGFGGR